MKFSIQTNSRTRNSIGVLPEDSTASRPARSPASGNQTVSCNVPALPTGAKGFNVYRNGFGILQEAVTLRKYPALHLRTTKHTMEFSVTAREIA
jgi:hypothetical protein